MAADGSETGTADAVVRWAEHWAQRAEVEDPISASGLNVDGEPLPIEMVRAMRQPWIDLLSVRAEDSVLEIGCGLGIMLEMLTRRSKSVFGVDFSIEMLSRYRGPASVGVATARDLPFAPGSFDKVLMASVAHYFPDFGYTKEVFHSAIEVLRPGGRVVVGDLIIGRSSQHASGYLEIDRDELTGFLDRLDRTYEIVEPSGVKVSLGITRHELVLDLPS